MQAVSEIDPTATGMVGKIPVRNLWLLMLYASDLYRSLDPAKVKVEEAPDDLPDLVAEILANAVETRQRRNLTSGFHHREADLTRVRGRIDHLSTARKQLLARGRIACRFEELTIDTPRNRFVRASLDRISRLVSRRALSRRCRSLAEGMRMMGVTGTSPTRSQMSTDRFGRHDIEDRHMVAAARLANDLALPTEVAGGSSLLSADRDEIWARRLFEKAASGLYSAALSPDGWKVSPGTPLKWQHDRMSEGMGDILPGMKTDIVLTAPGQCRRVVVDTKFTSLLGAGYFKDLSLKSAYLYQIYAYLLSQHGQGGLDDTAEGLMLHPAVEIMIDEEVTIQGHRIRFATVDLTADPHTIRKQFLEAVSARDSNATL